MEFQLVLVDTVLLCGITDDSSITQPEGMILSSLGMPYGPNVVRASICALLHRNKLLHTAAYCTKVYVEMPLCKDLIKSLRRHSLFRMRQGRD